MPVTAIPNIFNTTVKSISCSNHVLYSTNQDSLYVFGNFLKLIIGSNKYGQLGLNHTTDSLKPILNNFFDQNLFLSYAGEDFSFIMTQSKSLYSFGRNDVIIF